jgi:Uma2 family endonuclease
MLDLENLAPGTLRPLKRVEYERMVREGLFVDERIELLDGFLVVMTPIGGPHAEAVDRLTELLVSALKGRARVRVQGPFAASDDSEPEPDLAIYPLQDYTDQHPSQALLVIEVADSSLRKDRGIKAPLYASAGVPEYWIVDVEGRAFEIYSAPVGGRYTHTAHRGLGDHIAVPSFHDVIVDVASILSRT